MDTKSILLAYASKFGSTQEVAESITATLRDRGLAVDLQPMQDIQNLEPYAAVVLGAAIYSAKWHADAHPFLAWYQEALEQRPVEIFALGPVARGEAALRNSRRQPAKELERYPWLKPAAVEIIAGKYDPKKPGLSFFERLMPASDYRDWDAIRAWANTLAMLLQSDGHPVRTR